MSDDDITDLPQLAARLLDVAKEAKAGRAAETILSGLVQRATVIALSAGSAMNEHDSPPSATLQVLAGHVRLSTQDRSWEARPGQFLAVPPQRHGVEALEDSAILLTVALND